jgi:hypothetical protein
MDWQTTYPTVETVMIARFETLQQWDENLPAAQTDVEHTVRRRIKRQMQVTAGQQVRSSSPELADKWNKVMDDLEHVVPGLKNIWRM